MRMKERVDNVLRLLDEAYPTEDKCYLHYNEDWQLLIATILSAQCTDDRVNLVTEALFKKYSAIDSFADADLKELEQDIRSTGFYHSKARNIIGAMKRLREHYGCVMPSEVEELTSLAGVGRKTANVVRTHIFHIPSIVVDTHVKRVSNKIGFTESSDPVKIEFELMKLFPKEHWGRYNTQVIAHGKSVCRARKPNCDACTLAEYCRAAGEKP